MEALLPHNYSRDGTELTPAVLDDATLLAIGRIFRAAAEIEDIVNLYLVRIAGMSEAHLAIMLGRAALSKKIDIARSFAKTHGEKEVERFKATLELHELFAAIEFRNTLAHGAMLGTTDEGRIAFRTAKQIGLDPTHLTLEVNSYLPAEFQHCADAMDQIVPWLEVQLDVAHTRAMRRAKTLHPHTKAQLPKAKTQASKGLAAPAAGARLEKGR